MSRRRRSHRFATRTFGDPTDKRLIVHPRADQVFVEQFRGLGAALHHAQIEEGIRSLMVTSGVGGEGKTLSATNLALMLSRSFGKRVLLIDADLRSRRSSAAPAREPHGPERHPQAARRALMAQALSPTLSVITGGERDPDPVSLLVSAAATRFLSTARDHFELDRGGHAAGPALSRRRTVRRSGGHVRHGHQHVDHGGRRRAGACCHRRFAHARHRAQSGRADRDRRGSAATVSTDSGRRR